MKTFFRMSIHFSLLVLFVVSFMGGFSPHPTEAADYIYWTNEGDGTDATVGMANLDGTGADQDIATIGDQEYGGVFARGDYIYWTKSEPADNSRIGRANWDGSNAEPNFIIITEGDQRPLGICVDSTYIYWTEPWGATDRISRALKADGSAREGFITTDLADPVGVCVDSTYIYWINYEDVATGNCIYRADLNTGGNHTKLSIDESNFDNGWGIAVNNTHIYWSNYDLGGTEGSIYRAELPNGTNATKLISNLNKPAFLAINPTFTTS